MDHHGVEIYREVGPALVIEYDLLTCLGDFGFLDFGPWRLWGRAFAGTSLLHNDTGGYLQTGGEFQCG